MERAWQESEGGEGWRITGGRRAGAKCKGAAPHVGEDFDSLILPCVALIRGEILPLTTTIEPSSFCLSSYGHELFICVSLTDTFPREKVHA